MLRGVAMAPIAGWCSLIKARYCGFILSSRVCLRIARPDIIGPAEPGHRVEAAQHSPAIG
jgi:hypothetical protein